MSLRVVFDTNVIVSAMLTSDGVCAHLLLLAIDGLAIPVIDARILHEYERVLRRPKFKLAPEAVNGVLRFLEETAETHVALPLNITHIPHPFEANLTGITRSHRQCGSRNAGGPSPKACRKAS